MSAALELAARGAATCRPNPQVGCVLVGDGEVVGQGWHRETGGPHAEVFALAQAGKAARGATAYVTLEPCSHQGRTPPCAEALIKAGLARVVVAMQDPYHEVAGQGLEKLKQAGIKVETGLLAQEARWLNRGFIKRCQTARPWLRLKMAASLDGRTALSNGKSQWITSPQARADVQLLRARSAAIMTGIGTVLADKPRMNVRLPDFPDGHQPLRVILDSRWQTPPDAPILKPPGKVIIAGSAGQQPAAELQAVCAQNGHSCLPLPLAGAGLDITALLDTLGRQQINEVQVEAGSKLGGSLINAGLVDELVVYLAPKLMGDKAHGMFDLPDLSSMQAVHNWRWQDTSHTGTDIRLTLIPDWQESTES